MNETIRLEQSSSTLSETDYAYLAGLIDGDGCFSYGTANGGLYVHLRIVNTYLPVMEHLVRLYGGYLSKQSGTAGWKVAHHYTLSASKLRILLPKILPHLIIKRDAALVVQEFLAIPVWNTITDRSDSVRTARKALQVELIDQLRCLNKKGAA